MMPLYVQGLKGTEYFYAEWNRVETEGSEILKKKQKKTAKQGYFQSPGKGSQDRELHHLLLPSSRWGSEIIIIRILTHRSQKSH